MGGVFLLALKNLLDIEFQQEFSCQIGCEGRRGIGPGYSVLGCEVWPDSILGKLKLIIRDIWRSEEASVWDKKIPPVPPFEMTSVSKRSAKHLLPGTLALLWCKQH